MQHLVLEFWENGVKKAECPASEVWDLSPAQQDAFWEVQDLLERAIMVRYEEDKNGL